MKSKFLNIAILSSSLIVYLEWGNNNSSFLFQAELDVIIKLFSDPGSIAHPLILAPLIGQFILIGTLFQKTISKKLTFLGFGLLAILISFVALAGILSINFKTLISTVPFFVSMVLTILHHRKSKQL